MSKYAAVAALAVSLLAACGGTTPQPKTSEPDPLTDGPSPQPTATAAEDPVVRDAIKKGESQIKAGDFKAAKETFTNVLDRKPGYPRALHYLGVCQENLGEKEAAEKSYRAALEKGPELLDPPINLSALLIESGRVDEALKVLRTALKRTPTDPLLHANIGHALRASGDKAGAVAEYKFALNSGDDPFTRLMLALLLVDMGKKDEAKTELKKVAAKATTREEFATIADAFGRLFSYGDCVSNFDKAISLKPAAELHAQRGVCRHELKDEAGAKSDYEAATKLDPNYVPAWYYLGMQLLGEKKPAEALKAFEKARQLKPDSIHGKKAAERIAEIKKKK